MSMNKNKQFPVNFPIPLRVPRNSAFWIFCSKCGTRNYGRVAYCEFCGTKLAVDVKGSEGHK